MSFWFRTIFLHEVFFMLTGVSEEITTTTVSVGHVEESRGVKVSENVNNQAAPIRYQVAEFNWHHVSEPYTIAIWIFIACFAKLGFNVSKKFSGIFPDSALLILVGLIVGIICLQLKIEPATYILDSKIFFLYLLPPIVFDAGYFMPNRAFFDNLGSILTFAVIGTVMNAAAIGLALWGIGLTGIFSVPLPLLHVLLFSSLISATDPVAVIAVFEEFHVNELLFVTVFGESLLNDAVSVVLYNIFNSFFAIGTENLLPIDYVAGGISFFTVSLGGVIIGIIWAATVSFTTKYTDRVEILNPVFIFLMPYCAYLTAEMFRMSSIIAIVFCGIAMKRYIKLNISSKAIDSVKYLTKMMLGLSETVVFMFLGLSAIRKHHWDIPFISLTVVFTLVFRTLGIILQSFFLNRYRMIPYSKVDRFFLSYGGLRGPIAYGLVFSLPDSIPAKDLFVTATFVVVYFTVFIQGGSIKPLIKWLEVERADPRQKTVSEYILEEQMDNTTAAIENVCGLHGHNWLRYRFEQINDRFIKPLLVKKIADQLQDSKIVRGFTRHTASETLVRLDGRISDQPPHSALELAEFRAT